MRAWAQRNDKQAFTIDRNKIVYVPILGTPFPYIPTDPQGSATYQYSFVGPLSMQKGCDNAFHMYTRTIDSIRNKPPNNGISFDTNNLSYRGMYLGIHVLFILIRSSKSSYQFNILGENPLVATDARCFMPWIASQYNMKLEEDYEERLNCRNGRGDRNNADQDKCL